MLQQLEQVGKGCLSVQCLAEFFSITTRGRTPKLTVAEASHQLDEFARACPVLPLTIPIVLEAARGVRDHQLAYYDAQVWATAKLNQIPIILSEDLPSRPVLESVRFLNPFAPDFAPEEWIQ